MNREPTVALSMIVKDELQEVLVLINQASPYVDEVNLVVSDAKTAKELDKVLDKKVHVKYRKWNNRFDEARNASMNMCTTDYFIWVDADDDFDFSGVPQLVQMAEENGIDAIFLPYNYMQDDQGNCVTLHWRERLIRMGRGYEWRGWVHETCISDENTTTHKVDFPVKHNATIDDAKNSHERNHQILEEAYAATKDPRYLHYLGMSYFTKKDYEKAVELFVDYLKVGGSVEDAYRSLSLLSECAYHLGKLDLALEYASKCIVMKPEYPMGYWLLAQYEADQENYEEALEWVRVSETKPDPNTLSVWDPTSRGRATIIAARSLFMLGRYNEALKEVRKVRDNPEIQEYYKDFVDQADAEMFVNILPKLRKFFESDKKLWDALAHDMKYDSRIQPLRFNVNEPHTWGDNSIVIFCGEGYEEWGPHTLDKGMGGSEEAVVYLSRELAKLGWHVTVFAEANMIDKEGTLDAVKWRPWEELDRRDKFNVFISWRAPQFAGIVDAKVKLIDVHDIIPEDVAVPYDDATYMFKSNYHKELYPKVKKAKVIGNGIKKEQFS